VFTQQHYIKIAKILKANEEENPYLSTKEFQSLTVQRFVAMFEGDNKKFNKENFLDAIYGKEKE